MLLRQWSENERFMHLFRAEAKLVSDLVHENIVQIYQLGRAPNGAYYIIMEYVQGLPLGDFIHHHRRRCETIPRPLAVHIVSRIARGLAYAHTFKNRHGTLLGIVHRDVCPRNILIATEGIAKLTDFGIAKAVDLSIIKDDWLIGKNLYMSPEQAACRPVDFRADLYSLGVVLFEMLAGVTHRPLDANPERDNFAELPVPWEALPAEVDPALVSILKRLLDPDPAQRFDSTREAAQALEYYIYKDGYGPTIQTVEDYLRRHFPALYLPESPPTAHLELDSRTTTVIHQG
jgi:serine/threonine protein kinase